MTEHENTTGPRGDIDAARAPTPRTGPAPIAGPALHRALGETSRAAIVALLCDHPGGLDAGRIAAATGLHPNTVRHHVDVLLTAGLVRARPDPTRTGGRPRRLFQTTRLAGGHNGEGYPLLAEIIVAELARGGDGAGRAIAAGRRWAEQQASADPSSKGQAAGSTAAAEKITAFFAEVGFQPELVRRADLWQILLHHCPFLSLARAHPDIVCGVHLGLLNGMLARHDVPPTAGTLVPFVEPTLCIATLPRTAA